VIWFVARINQYLFNTVGADQPFDLICISPALTGNTRTRLLPPSELLYNQPQHCDPVFISMCSTRDSGNYLPDFNLEFFRSVKSNSCKLNAGVVVEVLITSGELTLRRCNRAFSRVTSSPSPRRKLSTMNGCRFGPHRSTKRPLTDQ
jgi:hypothetical protein